MTYTSAGVPVSFYARILGADFMEPFVNKLTEQMTLLPTY